MSALALSIITYVGLTLSSICLVIMIIGEQVSATVVRYKNATSQTNNLLIQPKLLSDGKVMWGRIDVSTHVVCRGVETSSEYFTHL